MQRFPTYPSLNSPNVNHYRIFLMPVYALNVPQVILVCDQVAI